MIENRICKGTNRPKAALSSGVTTVQVMVATARSVRCGSNEAVTLLTLIVVHCNDFDSYKAGNIQSSYSVTGFDESVYHSSS